MNAAPELWRHPAVRALGAALALLGTVALLWPAPAAQDGPSWDALLTPEEPLLPGWRLSAPRRGGERDVIVRAQRDSESVELHVLPRGQWEGVPETGSFGVAWEVPRTHADPERARAIRDALRDRIDGRDPGDLPAPDRIPLVRATEAPALARALRGSPFALAGAALLLLAGLALLADWPVVVTLLLFALAGALRLPHLDLPFVWDQDVQRVLLGGASPGALASGEVGDHRTPPLFFFLLHAFQWLGQAPWVSRLPAALAGASVAPLVWLFGRRGDRSWGPPLIAAFLLAVSPTAVAASREVSALPLVALLLLVVAAAAPREGDRSLAPATTLALWTHHVAGLALVGAAAALGTLRTLRRDRLRALALGVLFGSPALVLAARGALLDQGARAAAAAQPGLAWGDRAPLEMLTDIGAHLLAAVGPVFLLLALVAGLRRGPTERVGAPRVAVAMAGSVVASMVLLTPFVRLQPYYVGAAVPLLAFAFATTPERGPVRAILTALGAAAVVGHCALAGPALARSHVAEDGAFMQAFAATLHAREAEGDAVLTVADYDAPLLAYELARLEGIALGMDDLEEDGARLRIRPLGRTLHRGVQVHGGDGDPGALALAHLEALQRQGPVWVIARSDAALPPLDTRLASCEAVAVRARARLLRCGAP